MATRATTLFSTNKVKAFCNVQGATIDAIIEQIADGCSDRIEAFTRRHFVTRAVTKVLDGDGSNILRLPNYPIASLTSAQYRFTLLDAWVSLDITNEVELDEVHGLLYLKQLCWPEGDRLAKVVYNSGYGAQDNAALPGDVYQIGLDYCKFVYDRWKANTITTGSITVGGPGGSAVVIPDIPKDMKDALAIHVRHRFL